MDLIISMNFFISVIFIALLFSWLVKFTGIAFIILIKKDYISKIIIFICLLLLCYFVFNIYYFKIINVIEGDLWKILFINFILIGFITLTFIFRDFRFDVIFLYLMVLLGSLIVVCNNHLFIIYLGLELQTFSLFLLISKNKWFLKGSEAGMKYFILSALASGFYLLGLTFLYSFDICLNLGNLTFLDFEFIKVDVGIILILISLFFKLGLFPFQFWLADVYEGSSWGTIGLIAILPKISILSVLLKLVFFTNIFVWVGLASIIIGTLSAINQTKIKRMLAYSSISHMGFIIIGLSLDNQEGYEVSLIYWLIYMIGFLVVLILGFNTIFSKDYKIIDLAGLYNVNRLLSFSWLIMFISISGIPPFSGFIAKWFLLTKLLSYNYIFISLICILFSIISAGYYLRVIQLMLFYKRPSLLVFKQILLAEKDKKLNIITFLLGFFIFFMIFIIFNLNPWILFLHYYLNFFN